MKKPEMQRKGSCAVCGIGGVCAEVYAALFMFAAFLAYAGK